MFGIPEEFLHASKLCNWAAQRIGGKTEEFMGRCAEGGWLAAGVCGETRGFLWHLARVGNFALLCSENNCSVRDLGRTPDGR